MLITSAILLGIKVLLGIIALFLSDEAYEGVGAFLFVVKLILSIVAIVFIFICSKILIGIIASICLILAVVSFFISLSEEYLPASILNIIGLLGNVACIVLIFCL